MALSFNELIRLILDGQNVDAATINRVLRDLDNNTQYLKDMFDAALLAEAIFDRDVSCETDLLIGMPAYYNHATQRYERAVAATYLEDGMIQVAESAYAWGIVSHKHNSTKCDLLLLGVATLDITEALKPEDIEDGVPIPGVYYLSSEAGIMRRVAAPVTVPICQVGPNSSVYVRPNLADVFTRHVHTRYELVCKPAGTATLGGGRWTISPSDPDFEGWLPVSDPIFAGKAPGGAVFGYNLSQSGLGSIWPPLPLEAVYVDWDRGVNKDVGATGVPLGPDGLITVDENGIWWNSDLDQDVPWPPGFASPTTTTPSPTTPETPRTLQMRMTIYFTKPVYQTSDTVVTSLTTDSPLVRITCDSDGVTPASTGALQIDVDLALAINPHDDVAARALKTLAENGTISEGPVVVGIKSGSSTLSVTTDPPGHVIPGGYSIGLITLSAQQTPLGGELPIVEVKLDGATLENYKNVMSLGLLNGRDSSFRGEYHIPKQLVGTSVKTRVRLWLLGRRGGNLPVMTLSARVISQPGANHANQPLPTDDDEIDVGIVTTYAIAIDNYIEVESDEISAKPGDSIQFTFSRNAEAGDGYADDVLVLKRLAIITNVA